MPVDRLSVTVPADLGQALRKLAEARGLPVSAIVTEAIELQVRRAALDVAIAEADRRFGAVPAAAIARAEADFEAADRLARKKRRKR